MLADVGPPMVPEQPVFSSLQDAHYWTDIHKKTDPMMEHLQSQYINVLTDVITNLASQFVKARMHNTWLQETRARCPNGWGLLGYCACAAPSTEAGQGGVESRLPEPYHR